MTLTMDHDEHVVLTDLIARRLRELRVEVRHTDRRDFRARLRQDEVLLERLLERLAPSGGGGAAAARAGEVSEGAPPPTCITPGTG